jgi:hypothetical protein
MQHRLSALLARGDPNIRSDDPEPALCDLLDDPVLELVLTSDRVRPAELLRIIKQARSRLGFPFAPVSGKGGAVRVDCLA